LLDNTLSASAPVPFNTGEEIFCPKKRRGDKRKLKMRRNKEKEREKMKEKRKKEKRKTGYRHIDRQTNKKFYTLVLMILICHKVGMQKEVSPKYRD
jgi:hypothetical protein